MAPRLVERVLERVAERMGRRPAWEGVERADLLGGAGRATSLRVTLAEEDFSGAWGRTPLRDDLQDDEHAEFPGFGGAA